MPREVTDGTVNRSVDLRNELVVPARCVNFEDVIGDMDPLTSSLSLRTSNDLEPSIAAMLDRKRYNVERSGEYSPLGTEAVRCGLERFLDREAASARVRTVELMGGGASNEQYSVELAHSDGRSERRDPRRDGIGPAT